jgi:hypothetical protein
LNDLFLSQKKAIRAITYSKWNSHSDPLFKLLRILPLHNLNDFHVCCFVYSGINNLLSKNFCQCSYEGVLHVAIIYLLFFKALAIGDDNFKNSKLLETKVQFEVTVLQLFECIHCLSPQRMPVILLLELAQSQQWPSLKMRPKSVLTVLLRIVAPVQC